MYEHYPVVQYRPTNMDLHLLYLLVLFVFACWVLECGSHVFHVYILPAIWIAAFNYSIFGIAVIVAVAITVVA
jgi:hypothetical protein